jgi:hypothetical protein
MQRDYVGVLARKPYEPLEIGAQTIMLVVRVSGWRGVRGDVSTGRAGVQLQVEPKEVIVLERDGGEHRVPTSDNTRLVLWGLTGGALMVAVASQVVARVHR